MNLVVFTDAMQEWPGWLCHCFGNLAKALTGRAGPKNKTQIFDGWIGAREEGCT